MTNNIESGRRFAIVSRALLSGDMQTTDTSWFSLDDILTIADKFNILGVFNSDQQHWRLVLKINENLSLKVYDPLYTIDNSHIYTYKPNERTTTIPSRPLQTLLKLSQQDIFRSESERLQIFEKKGYELTLPQRFRNEGLQQDSYNCGPLVLYAAFVGNKYTSNYNHADFGKLKEMCGIEIR